ncbi:MAG: putative toxin-antitoxin system toxin component, PIN family [bacterium]
MDTNIWISFLIGKTLAGLEDAIVDDQVKILFSTELFDELIEVLQRPKFKKYFSNENIQEFVSLIHSKVKWVKIKKRFNDCRDAKDNFLLDLSVSGNADYLITGDKNLLVLNPFHGTEIISYRTFQTVLESIKAGE